MTEEGLYLAVAVSVELKRSSTLDSSKTESFMLVFPFKSLYQACSLKTVITIGT